MKGKVNEKSCGVYFNLQDPEQKRLNEYAKSLVNFSGHIKRVLQRELEGYDQLLFQSEEFLSDQGQHVEKNFISDELALI